MTSQSEVHRVLIAGRWRAAEVADTFRATDPATGEALADIYPVSAWSDADAALDAAHAAAAELRETPAKTIAAFLRDYADRIGANADAIIAVAHQETAYPVSPRLKDAELPRTVNQLRQAADAAEGGSWAMPTIDTKNELRSVLAPVGPVAVFGPNNFPFAYGSASGGDFASAIAAGCPVIAKGHPLHPGTARLFAEQAHEAAVAAGLPAATVQLMYHLQPDDGLRLVADRRLGATGFTGSRAGGLALKAAADAAGKPIYLEMSSVNPVVLLPGALAERNGEIAEEFVASALLAAGQFCTSPGLVLMVKGIDAERFTADVAGRYHKAAAGTLLSKGVKEGLVKGVRSLKAAGAEVVAGGESVAGKYAHENTLLRVAAADFLADADALGREAFGNSSMLVVADNAAQLAEVIRTLEGELTGSIYSSTDGSDDADYAEVAAVLRPRVGRLLNDKMPTGVAVSPAMQHGGPYPASGHGGFTAVGFPASIRRWGLLQAFDHVRPNRLPPLLRDENPTGAWRLIDGEWTRGNA